MDSRVYEWLRAADLKPDDQMVTTRTNAMANLETRIRESRTYDLLLGTVTGSVGGCELLGEQSAAFTTLLDCVRAESPAFPSSLSENALHLRMICCLGLGKLLSSAPDQGSDADELLSSSLLVSGLGLKQKEAGQHLDKVFEELGSVARANLQKQAVALRKRVDVDWNDFDSLKDSASNPATFNENLLPIVKGLFRTFQKQHELDREELEVMWWLYNGYSEHLEKQLKSVTPYLAATAIGSGLADRIGPPATIGMAELAAHATIRERPVAQVKPKPIGKIVAEVGEAGRKLLLPSAENVRNFVRSKAVLLPLSWLCMRLEESQGATGWEAELESKARLSSGREVSPGELAAQVFIERQAQRVYQSLVGGAT